MNRRNPHLIRTALVVTLVGTCLFHAADAVAQGPKGPMQAGHLLERATDLLDRTTSDWDRVRRDGKKVPRVVKEQLQLAATLLVRAQAALANGDRRKAENLATQALGLVERARFELGDRGPSPGPINYAHRAIDRASDAVEQAMREMGPDHVNVEALRRQLDRAKENVLRGRPEIVMHLLRSIEAQARAFSRGHRSPEFSDRRRETLTLIAGRAVRRAETLTAAGADERSRRLVALAKEHFGLATSEPDDNRALRLLELSAREADRVIRTLDRQGFHHDRIARTVERARSAAQRALEAAAEIGDDDALTALAQQSERLAHQSTELLESGDPEGALGLAHRARVVASQVVAQAIGGIDAQDAKKTLDRIDRILVQAQQAARTEAQIELIGKAASMQETARRALVDGDLTQAMARTRVAARMARRAMALVDQP